MVLVRPLLWGTGAIYNSLDADIILKFRIINNLELGNIRMSLIVADVTKNDCRYFCTIFGE